MMLQVVDLDSQDSSCLHCCYSHHCSLDTAAIAESDDSVSTHLLERRLRGDNLDSNHSYCQERKARRRRKKDNDELLIPCLPEWRLGRLTWKLLLKSTQGRLGRGSKKKRSWGLLLLVEVEEKRENGSRRKRRKEERREGEVGFVKPANEKSTSPFNGPNSRLVAWRSHKMVRTFF